LTGSFDIKSGYKYVIHLPESYNSNKNDLIDSKQNYGIKSSKKTSMASKVV
jgi:hypothetical protein